MWPTFVFIITLAVAILLARSSQKKADEQADILRQQTIELQQRVTELHSTQDKLSALEARLIGNDKARRGLLESIQSNLDVHFGIHVNIDAARGVLRIPESAISFAVGSASLDASNEEKLNEIGKVLNEELRCFTSTFLANNESICHQRNPLSHTLDAVFVEGHTDNQTYRGDTTGSKNLMLSTSRSNTVFQTLMKFHPELSKLKNDKDEVLFSLSGYGFERPVPGHFHEKPTDDSANRRIELRLILTEPKMSQTDKIITQRAADLIQK